MEKYERITDDEIFKVIKAIDDEDEQSLAGALKALLLITLDTRQFIRKMYKNKTNNSKVYKRPTNNSKDIITGAEKMNRLIDFIKNKLTRKKKKNTIQHHFACVSKQDASGRYRHFDLFRW